MIARFDHVQTSLACDGPLIGGVDDKVRDLDPLEHRDRTSGHELGLLEALS